MIAPARWLSDLTAVLSASEEASAQVLVAEEPVLQAITGFHVHRVPPRSSRAVARIRRLHPGQQGTRPQHRHDPHQRTPHGRDHPHHSTGHDLPAAPQAPSTRQPPAAVV